MLFVLWLLYSLPHCFYTAFLASIMPLVFCIFHIYNFFSLNFVVSRFRYTFCLVCLVLLYLVLTTVLQFKLRLSLSFEYNQPIFENAKGVVFHQDIETHRELFYKCKVDSLMEWWWLLVRVWRMRIFQVTCLCVCHTEKTIAVDNARKTAFVVWVQHR